MKNVLLAALVAAPLFSLAQNNALSGNWVEVRRSDVRGAAMDFNDSIKINFLPGNEYTWLKKGGFIYRGTYKIENGMMDMGSRQFKLLGRSDNKITLADDAAVYEFRPYTDPVRRKLPNGTTPEPVADISQLVGTWKVFKGTSSSTMKELDLSTRVKTVMIFDRPDQDGDIGYVSAGKDPKGKPSWKINKFENSILYCNGKTVRLFEVMKADKELILREDNMTYFMKQFTE